MIEYVYILSPFVLFLILVLLISRKQVTYVRRTNDIIMNRQKESLDMQQAQLHLQKEILVVLKEISATLKK